MGASIAVIQDFEDYLARSDLAHLTAPARGGDPDALVCEAGAASRGPFTPGEVRDLYTYRVPKLDPSGACSRTHELEEQPYHLAASAGLPADAATLATHPNTLRLWRLRHIVARLQALTGVDWLGVYRRVHLPTGGESLVKEAYVGAPSRAEFPLTPEFAQQSNNSTVGLTGKAIVVQDVAAYQGPYYSCDALVQSEFCAPILDRSGHVAGIIDAESFAAGAFTPALQAQIARVAFDLGQADLARAC